MTIKVDYHSYLASREWRLKRKEVIEMNGNVCQRCACRPIQNVHHRSYENLGHEDPDRDLIGVCRPCHEYLAAEQETDPALEVIDDIITEHGLFPLLPGQYGAFTSATLENGLQLWMELRPEGNDDMFYRGLPQKVVCKGTIAFFFWI